MKLAFVSRSYGSLAALTAVTAVISLALNGCTTTKSGADANMYTDITAAVTTESPVIRETALIRLLQSAQEISCPKDLIYRVEDTNCDCSQFDATTLVGFRDPRIFHIVDNYYLHYGSVPFSPDEDLSLLIALRYPNETLRFAIVAQQKLSNKGSGLIEFKKPSKF